MKRLKGWQLLKLIQEGKLKEGQEITYYFSSASNASEMKREMKISSSGVLRRVDRDEEVGGSFFICDESEGFVIEPRKVTFAEVLDSDKKVKVVLEEVSTPQEFMTFDDLLKDMQATHYSEKCRKIFKEGTWYLEMM